jgi:hypothetical protein
MLMDFYAWVEIYPILEVSVYVVCILECLFELVLLMLGYENDLERFQFG